MSAGFDGATEKEKEFYFWVGKCIKIWAQFDDSLFGLFAVALKPHYEKAGEIYWRISSVETRIQNVSAVLEVHLLPQPLKSGQHAPREKKEWDSLFKQATELLPYRNFVAHQPSWYKHEFQRGPSGRWDTEIVWHTRLNRVDAARRRNPKDLGPTHPKAMKQHHDSVRDLAKQIRAFASKLEAQLIERQQQQAELELRAALASRGAKDL